MGRHNRLREQYIASYITLAKSLQWVDGDDLAIDVDDEHVGGGWSLPEGIPAAFPPSDLLRREPSDSLFHGFVFLRRLYSRKPWGTFI